MKNKQNKKLEEHQKNQMKTKTPKNKKNYNKNQEIGNQRNTKPEKSAKTHII